MVFKFGGNQSGKDSTQRLLHQWQTLTQLMGSLRVNTDQKDALRQVFDQIQAITGFQSTALYLQTFAGDPLTLVAETGMPVDERTAIAAMTLTADDLNALMPPDCAIVAGRAFRLGNKQYPVISRFTRSRQAQMLKFTEGWHPHDTLVIPLRENDDQPITGMLLFDTPEDPRLWNQQHNDESLALVLALSSTITMIIENYRIFLDSVIKQEQVESGLIEIMRQVDLARRGTLTARVPIGTSFLDTLADQFNQMVIQMGQTIRDVQTSSKRMTTDAASMHLLVDDITDNTYLQTRQIDRFTQAMIDIAGTIEVMAQQSEEAANEAAAARDEADDGRLEVEEAVIGVMDLREVAWQSALRVKRLADSLQQIQVTIGKMHELMEQMNILSVNTSVESARLGAQGQGVTAIAQRLRSIATSGTATIQQVGDRVGGIQSEALIVVRAVDEYTELIIRQTDRIIDAGTRLQALAESTSKVADRNLGIREQAQEEAGKARALAQEISEIRLITEDTRQKVQEIAETMRSIAELATTLDTKAHRFTV